jgi:hypothetical protein
METNTSLKSESGVKYKELAAKLGISTPYMSDILNGKREPLDLMVEIERLTGQELPGLRRIREKVMQRPKSQLPKARKRR